MNPEKIVKSSQEQAFAAWIGYLNQIRLDRLAEALSKQNLNFAAAMDSIEKALAIIKTDIISRNRGGDKGMHGFIAEIAECGIGNARQQIVGKAGEYVWINDNGPVDILRGADIIQQKFVQSGGHLSLQAITQHMQQYPDFLADGGKYQIPKDHYDKIMAYLSMPESAANKLPTSTGEFSLRQWREVHNFFAANNVEVSQLEPSLLEYGDVQRDAVSATFEQEKVNLEHIDKEQRKAAYQDSKPTVEEGAKAAAVGAAVEGATVFLLAIVRKRRAGKQIKDFNEADWLEIVGATGKGTIKGGIRGTSIYLLTNYTGTPAAVASAFTTAAFGVAEQAHLLRKHIIDEQQFLENAEILCLDAAVSGLASFLGQAMIPVPILGAVIGNAVGTLLYQIGKDGLLAREDELIKNYIKEIADLDCRLKVDYQRYIEKLNMCYTEYLELLTAAFNPGITEALEGSVVLAEYMGVASEEILDSYDKIVSYFMD